MLFCDGDGVLRWVALTEAAVLFCDGDGVLRWAALLETAVLSSARLRSSKRAGFSHFRRALATPFNQYRPPTSVRLARRFAYQSRLRNGFRFFQR